jgi:hypothetical protein
MMVSCLQQNVFRSFTFTFSTHNRIQAVGGVIPDLLNEGIRVGLTLRNTFGCDSVRQMFTGYVLDRFNAK